MLTVSDVMRMKDRNDIEGLLRALGDQDIAVRAEAASSLGSLGDKRAVEPLIVTLQNDSDPYVRSLAATALGELGDERARTPLINCIASDTMDVSMAASKAQFMLEANIARGTGKSGKTEPPASPSKSQPKVSTAPGEKVKAGAKADPPKGKGCAVSFWELVRVYLYIMWITVGISFLFGAPELVNSANESGDFWLVLFVIVFGILLILGISWVFLRLIRAVSNRLNKLKGITPEDSATVKKKPSSKPVKPQVKKPTRISQPSEYTTKIGTVDILWKANKQAVGKFKALADSSGITLREAISSTMGMSGSRNELVEQTGQISLSPVRKVWCQTTPIYLDKIGGGIYVLFEKLDEKFTQEKELEYLGTIDAVSYAAALCMANGLDPKNVVV